MKCKNCGGDLIFENSIWTCTSCGSQFSMMEFCGEVDVFICYSESDENGRRTKDSVIAQEIYNLLEQYKIKAFYKRVSLENVTGRDAEVTEEAALNVSKIVLVIGTSKDSFEKLWERYEKNISSKKIIPVYLGMDAKYIPTAINSIQALKYDQVGASSDLISVVSRFLGRKIETEQNYKILSNKQQNKTRVLVIVISIIMLIILVVGTLVVWNLVAKPRNSTDELSDGIAATNKSEEDAAETDQKDKEALYSESLKHIDNSEYADAIIKLSELGDYKDSSALLKTCYAKYSGYYYDEENGVYFQLQHYEDNGSIEIYAMNEEGKKCTISETIKFDGCRSDFTFNDSENNHGSGKIVLNNTGVDVSVKTSDVKSEVYLPDITISFSLKEKADQPISEDVSSDFYRDILINRTTIGDLNRLGYDLSYETTLDNNGYQQLYKIDNTEILVAVSGFEQDKLYDYAYGIVIPPEHEEPDFSDEKDYIVVAIQGPASIIIPDKIGETDIPIINDNLIYCPNCEIWSSGFIVDFMYTGKSLDEREEIKEDTPVSMCSRTSVGNNEFKQKLEDWGIYSGYEGNEISITNDNDDYILPYSSSRNLTESDLEGLSNDELRKARNEIVARHGRRFQDAELQAYFDSKPWYSGTIDPDDFNIQTMLSDIERDNMDFIKEREE